MQTSLNNPPRAHSRKIEFPSQTRFPRSSFRGFHGRSSSECGLRALPLSLQPRWLGRKSKERFSGRRAIRRGLDSIIRAFYAVVAGTQPRRLIPGRPEGLPFPILPMTRSSNCYVEIFTRDIIRRGEISPQRDDARRVHRPYGFRARSFARGCANNMHNGRTIRARSAESSRLALYGRLCKHRRHLRKYTNY